MSIRALADHDYTEEAVDITTICRTCAKLHEILIPIFSEEGLQNNLAGVMNKYLPIKVSENDELPGSVCYQCAHTLLAWHQLVTCCQKVEDKLRSRIFHVKQKKSDSGTARPTINEYKKWTTSSVNLMINKILAEDLDIDDGDKFFLQFVCQQCPNKPASSDIQQLTEHINVAHLAATDSKEALRNFLTNNITFEEAVQKFGSGYDSETEKEHSKVDTDNASTCSKQKKTLQGDDHLFEEPLEEFENNEKIDTKNSVANTINVLTLKNINNKPLKECKSGTEIENGKVVEIRNKTNYSLTNYHCLFCSSMFPSFAKLNHHMKIHDNSDEINYSNKDSYIKHYQDSHVGQQEVKTSTLDLASRSTTISTEDTKTSINISHQNKKQNYNPVPCPYCKKVLSNRYSLRIHLRCHSDTGQRFYCNECSKSYNVKGNLRKHIKKVHLKVLPFICKECGKAFAIKSTLRDHFLISHTKESLFSCKICLKRFRRKPGLRHFLKHVNEGLLKEEELIGS